MKYMILSLWEYKCPFVYVFIMICATFHYRGREEVVARPLLQNPEVNVLNAKS